MNVFDDPRGSKRDDSLGRRLIAATLWHKLRQRAGDVLDSRQQSVRWGAVDDDQSVDISAPDLPGTTVVFRLEAVTALVGASTMELEMGSRSIRRSTYGASATVDGRTYRLVQRGRRLAELRRNEDTIAVLARPRRGSPSVNWAQAAVTTDEIALGHALAVSAGIGSPGAVANILAVLPF